MKKTLSLFCAFLLAFSFLIGCNNDDNKRDGSSPIIGTWKLVEEFTNNQSVSLSACDLEETYIFGPEQFTHELYENTNSRFGNFSSRDSQGSDDSDDDGDDDSDDSDDDGDDHSDDDGDDHSDDSDDDTDDTPGSGNCVVSERIIGYWTAQENTYTFTVSGTNSIENITFENGNTRFYIQKMTTVNGQTVTKRYVYQKQ